LIMALSPEDWFCSSNLGAVFPDTVPKDRRAVMLLAGKKGQQPPHMVRQMNAGCQ
jgi:hypothetical protein